MAIVKDIDITPKQRENVCSILATHFPDTEVWAYGSRVHWNATSSSDLDLVVFSSDTSGLANCRDAFAESSLPFRVDLFLWDKIPANFQNRIKQEYAILLQSERSDWNTKQLGCVTHWKSGGTPNKSIKEYWNGKIPWISAKNLKTDHITDSEIHISEEGLSRGSRLADKDEILILVRGSELFNRIPISFLKKPVAFNQDVKAIKANEELYPSFLFYWLKSKETFLKSKVESTGIGAGKLDTTFLQNIAISYPTISEQKRIAGILSAFDDKIELNRKMCKTLETMAEALFKSWFVDFEPVRAKIAAIKNGKDPELAAIMSISGKTEVQLAEMKTFYPDAYSELAHTASLFPSTMVENEDFYEIPEDWDIYNFSDILQESKEKCGDLDVPEFSVTDNGIVPRNEKFKKNLSASKNKNKLLCKNQLVFGMSREILNWGIMADEIGGVSSVYNVFNVSSDIDPEYLRMFITNQLIYFKDLIKPAAREGQSIDRKVLMQKKIYIPSKKLLEYWLKLHSTMNNRMKWLMEQQQTHLKQQENILQHIFTTEES